MKKNYLLLLFVALTSLGVAQTTVFTQAVDGNWSTAGNWSAGLPTSSSIAVLNANAVLNLDATVKELRVSDFSLTGTKTLTCNVNIASHNSNAINMNGGSSFEIGVPLVINNSLGGRTKIRCNGASPQTITFNASSSLKVVTTGELAPGSGNTINMNGALLGSDVLRLDDVVNFGGTSDNSAFTGSIQLLQPANVTVNSTTSGGFLPALAGKLQVNGNATVTLNTPDVLRNLINFGNAKTLTLNVNAPQPSIGPVAFVGSGTFNLVIDAAVPNVSFANSNEDLAPDDDLQWNTGVLNITGFVPGVIRFGTDNTGLTTSQLAAITADGVGAGEALGLDTSGYLVLASTLSYDDNMVEKYTRISFPFIVDTEVSFSKTVEEVKVINVNGQIVGAKSNATNLDVSRLKTGLYFLKFKNGRVERFVKK
tara:strand:- start:5044 stop:6315 length:1272 start_codon:yes stop_codon:yes gene_type:complete